MHRPFLAVLAIGVLAVALGFGFGNTEAHVGHPPKKLFNARWYQSHLDLSTSYNDPDALFCENNNYPACAAKWNQIIGASLNDWNAQPDTARFIADGFYDPNEDVVIRVWDETPFGPQVLGIALTWDAAGDFCPLSSCGTYRWGEAWIADNPHAGSYGTNAVRQATVTHELGHLLSLRHESVNANESQLYECGWDNTGPIPTSVMSYDCINPPSVGGSGLYTVQNWDVCGVNHAYPDPAFEWESCVCYAPPAAPAPPPGPPAYYHPLTPARVLDTRIGTGGFTGRLGFGCHIDVQVAGVGGVPASGVTAVVVNVTVTQPSRGSFLTVYPSDAGLAVASNLNFVPGQTVPNLVTVKVGADGKVKLYNAVGQTHVIFDVVGWYGGTTGGSPTATPSPGPSPTPPPSAPPGSVTTYQMNALHDGRGTGSLSLPLSEAWSVPLGGTPGYPLVVNGRVFVAAGNTGPYGAKLYAIHEQTGSILWGPIDLPGTYYINSTAADGANVYAVNFDGLLRAFNQATGQQAWQTQLPSYTYWVTAPPTVSGGVIYLSGAGSGGRVYAVNATTGSILWSVPISGSGERSSPAVTGDGVYVSYNCANVSRHNPGTGQSMWTNTGCSAGGGRVPVVHGNRLYARDSPGSPPAIYALADGANLGTFSSFHAPAFDVDLGFYTPSIAGSITLQAVNLTSGSVVWTGGGGVTTAPIVVDGKVIVGFSGSVGIYDEYTGAFHGYLYPGAAIPPTDEHNAGMLTGLAATGGKLFVPASDRLVAFQSSSTPAPTPTGGATPSPTPAATATPTPTPTAAPTATPTSTPAPTGFYHPLPPSRVLDTRYGVQGIQGKLGPGGAVDVQVTGIGGVPPQSSGVTAVVLNVTVTEPSDFSYLTVYPTGVPRPLASNLNFGAGQTVPNLAIVKVGASGKVTAFNCCGSTHVIFDVVGWYGPAGSDGTLFRSLSPARIMDTRIGVGWSGKIGPNATATIDVTGVGGVPASAKAVVVNTTVTEPSNFSYLTVYPSGVSQPLASNLNFAPGQTVPNLVMVKVGLDGNVKVYNAVGQTHVIFDVVGYFE